MQNYSSNVADPAGNAVAFAMISIFNLDGTPAALFSNSTGTAPLPNPFPADAYGRFNLFAANGAYKGTAAGNSILGVPFQFQLYDPNDAPPATLAAIAANGGSALVGNGGETVADSLNALQLADYTALRAYAGPRKSVYVTGYLGTAAPSGIAGMFVRDDSDTTTADNGGTVIVAGNGTRWKRQYVSPVDVLWFGAKGDGVTDDGAAINAAIAYVRTLPSSRANGITDITSPYFCKASALQFPAGHRFLTTIPLWFGIDSGSAGWDSSKIVETVIGHGAVIIGRTNGKPVLDLCGAFGMKFYGLSVFGDASTASAPNIGILLARSGNAAGNNPSAGLHRFTNVNVHGDFTLACVYNYASEINEWANCFLYQNSGTFVYLGTNNNARYAVTSNYCTVATTVQSAYGDTFISGSYKSSTGNTAANGAVFCFESLDFGPKLLGCYIDSSGTVTMPDIWLRNAQGLTSGSTTSFNQGVDIDACVFEYRANQDIIVVDADHVVLDMTISGNSMPVNSGGGHYHLNVSSTAKVRNLRVQRTDGGTLGDPFLVGGTGEVWGDNIAVSGLRASTLGSGWQYVEGNLTRDGAFHTIDLSVYGVPTNARFVAVKVAAKTTAAADLNTMQLRASGVANSAQYMEITPPVSNITVQCEGLVPVSGGKIDYSIPANFNFARILLREFHM